MAMFARAVSFAGWCTGVRSARAPWTMSVRLPGPGRTRCRMDDSTIVPVSSKAHTNSEPGPDGGGASRRAGGAEELGDELPCTRSVSRVVSAWLEQHVRFLSECGRVLVRRGASKPLEPPPPPKRSRRLLAVHLPVVAEHLPCCCGEQQLGSLPWPDAGDRGSGLEWHRRHSASPAPRWSFSLRRAGAPRGGCAASP